jgi:hypothetical protein
MSNLATIVNNILADSGIDDINVVVTTGSYSNPAWITALAWTKITGTPTTLSGYGITNAYTKTEVDNIVANYLPLAGGTMTGNINWAQTDRGLTWVFNTDGAYIKFYNTGDGDTNSRLEFATIDNNDEYFRWGHVPSGGSFYESMKLVPISSGNAELTVSGKIIKAGGTSSQYLMADGSVSTLTNPVTGTGIANYVARWTSASAISTGVLIDNGTNVGISETSPNNKLYINAGAGTPAFNTGVTIRTGTSLFTSGDGGMLQFQNEDVITAGIRGVRASGWGSSLIFYVHNAVSGNTFGTSFVPVLTLNESLNAIFQGAITANGDVFINGDFSIKSANNGHIFLKNITAEANSWIYQEASVDWGMFAVNSNSQLNALGGIFSGAGLATFITSSSAIGVNLSSTTGGGGSYGAIAFVHGTGDAYFQGRIGVGTFAPSQKLDVRGTIFTNSGGTERYFQMLGYNNSYATIRSNVGFNSSYNSLNFLVNVNSDETTQGNASIPSWQMALGGNLPDGDSFCIQRSAAGSFSFTNLFKLTSAGAATFSSSVTSTGLIVNGQEFYYAPANYASGGFTRLLGRNASTGRIEGMSAADIQAFIGLSSYVSGSGTTNYLPKFTGASTIGNSQIFDNGTSVIVNGSTSSDARFIANGNSSGYAAYFSQPSIYAGYYRLIRYYTNGNVVLDIGSGNGTNLGIVNNQNDSLYFGTNGQQHLTIFGSGNVHVGLNPSSDAGFKLDVNGTGRFSGNVAIGTTDTENYRLGITTNTLGINFKGFYDSSNFFTIARTTYFGTQVCETQIRAYNPSNGLDADLGLLVMNTSSVLREVIRIKGSTERVGILTNSPSYTLDVSGRIRAFTASSGVSPRTDLGGTIIAEGDTRAGLYILTTGTAAGSYGSIWWGNGNTNTDAFISVENNTRAMRFGTADGTRMSITSGGNVGIGRTDPVSRLEVSSDSEGSGFTGITVSNWALSNARAGIAFKGYDWVQSAIWHGRGIGGNLGGALVFGTNPNTANLSVGGVVGRMWIFNSGNVGINTDDNDNGSRLHVSSAGTQLHLSGNGNNLQIYSWGGGVNLFSNEFLYFGRDAAVNNKIYFQARDASSTTLFVDTSTQRIGIGTTSTVGIVEISRDNVNVYPRVNRSSTGYEAGWKYSTGGTDSWYIGLRSADGTGSYHFYSYTTNSSVVSIKNDGEMLIGYTTDQGNYKLQVNGNVFATAYFESSDIRLKEVLNKYEGESFGAIEYKWNDKRDSKIHWGYSAQEVMKFLPDAVNENEDGYFTLDYNQAHTFKIAYLEKRITELEQQLKNK